MHTYIHTYILTYLHTATYRYMPLHAATYPYIPLHTYLPTYLPSLHTYLHTYIHTRTYIHVNVICFNQPVYIYIYGFSVVTITSVMSQRGAIAKALEYDPRCLHGHGCVNDRNIILYCIHVAFVVSYCLTVPHLQ